MLLANGSKPAPQRHTDSRRHQDFHGSRAGTARPPVAFSGASWSRSVLLHGEPHLATLDRLGALACEHVHIAYLRFRIQRRGNCGRHQIPGNVPLQLVASEIHRNFITLERAVHSEPKAAPPSGWMLNATPILVRLGPQRVISIALDVAAPLDDAAFVIAVVVVALAIPVPSRPQPTRPITIAMSHKPDAHFARQDTSSPFGSSPLHAV